MCGFVLNEIELSHHRCQCEKMYARFFFIAKSPRSTLRDNTQKRHTCFTARLIMFILLNDRVGIDVFHKYSFEIDNWQLNAPTKDANSYVHFLKESLTIAIPWVFKYYFFINIQFLFRVILDSQLKTLVSQIIYILLSLLSIPRVQWLSSPDAQPWIDKAQINTASRKVHNSPIAAFSYQS